MASEPWRGSRARSAGAAGRGSRWGRGGGTHAPCGSLQLPLLVVALIGAVGVGAPGGRALGVGGLGVVAKVADDLAAEAVEPVQDRSLAVSLADKLLEVGEPLAESVAVVGRLDHLGAEVVDERPLLPDEADEVADGLLRGGEAGLDAVVVAVEERLGLQTVAPGEP